MPGYNFDFAMSANLSVKVVEEMIQSVVEQQTGKKVATVEFKFKNVTKGNQRDSWTEAVLEGCTVTFIKGS